MPSMNEIAEDVVGEIAVSDCANKGDDLVSISKSVNPKTTKTFFASDPVIPAAVQKSERQNSKRTVAECNLAKTGIKDVCVKKTCIKESQKIEPELETSASGELVVSIMSREKNLAI